MKNLFNKATMLTTVLLLAWIALFEYLFHTFSLPTWPFFTCMVSFFLAEQKKEKIVEIALGAVFGEFMMFVLVKGWLPLLMGAGMAAFPAQLIFVLLFVGVLVVFGPALPQVLNSFAFLFFLVAALGNPFEPFKWMIISGIGGPIVCLGCVLIVKIVKSVCAPKSEVKE